MDDETDMPDQPHAARAAAGATISRAEFSAYETLPRPFGPLMILVLPLLTAIPVALYYGDVTARLAELSRVHPVAVIAFAANGYIFICFWLIYFASAWSRTRQWQTLRVLLTLHSNQWGDDEHPTRVADLRKKAGTTMTTQAIFVSNTVFIMSGLARDAYLVGGPGVKLIDHVVGVAALSAATASFTLILVSTDAAETMFNTFVKVREERAVSRLYKISARLKYYGFVLCFVSVALYVFTMNAVVASMAVALMMFVGYTYWFPDVSPDMRHKWEQSVFRIGIVAMNLALAAYYVLHKPPG